MHSRRAAFTSWTRVAVAVAMLALAVRVLVPAGYMPGGAGQPPLVLCTGQGAQIVLAAGGEHHGAPSDDHSGQGAAHHPCAFASAAHVFAAPDLAPAVLSAWSAQAPDLRAARIVSPGRGLAAPPPPATGPPLSI